VSAQSVTETRVGLLINDKEIRGANRYSTDPWKTLVAGTPGGLNQQRRLFSFHPIELSMHTPVTYPTQDAGN